MIYTPQMIIGGHANVEGARPMELMDEVRDARKEIVDVDLRLTRRGDRLTIRADKTALDGAVAVQLVRYVPTQTVDILRGENRGHSLTYANVVTSWKTVRNWDGKSALSLLVTVKGDDSIAVILQHAGPARIISAATLN